MKVSNKLITILIAITLVFNFVILENFNVYANTVENIDKNDIPDIIKTYENPIYKGLNIKEYSPKENINSKSVPIFNTLEEAAVFVRDEMVNRKGNISFILPYELYYREICIDIVHLAMKDSDNGKSSEGDYLAKHYSGFGVSTKWHTNTQLQYNLEMRYLSTYEQEEQVDKAVKEVLEDLDIEEKDDYTKIKLIHDYIVENIRYDYTKNHYSAYNAIIDKSVKCQGFSTLTYKMLKESGLKVRYISGTSDTGRHGWNIVKLGDKWYNIDNTWDSCYSESGPISYTWFLKGMNDFPKHYRNSEYNTSEFNKNYPMATNAYNYTVMIKFNDIKGYWAEETINSFTNQGYINGYEDNTFRPDNNMSRAEFVKVVNKVFGYTQKGEEQFTDVNENDWFYEDICIGIKAGYINGKSKDIFAPNDNITRQEVAMILTNIMNNKDENLDKLSTFKDGDKTSQWAQSSVEGAIEAGYINGDDEGLLNPISNITRAEAITMLSRVKK